MRYFLIFLFSFSLSTVKSQNQYFEGYLITQKGDTIFGQIKDRKITPYSAKLYKKIRFKQVGKISKRYSPAAILGYGYQHSHFRSCKMLKKSFLLNEHYFVNNSSGQWYFLLVSEVGTLSCYLLEEIDFDNNTIDHIALIHLQGHPYMLRAEQGVFGVKKKAVSEYLKDYAEIVELINANHFKTARSLCIYFNEQVQP